eukprot:Gb_40082 [translate_table: standard]
MAGANRKWLWSFLIILVLWNCLVPYALAHGVSHDGGGGGSGSADDKRNLRAKALILVKIWCLIIVFFVTFAGGISPYFYRWNESFLVLGTQFAGGVFLGTALMHFLSDSNKTFGDLTDKEYPFAFMLSTAGYLITMLSDCIITWVYQKQAVIVNNGDVEKEANSLAKAEEQEGVHLQVKGSLINTTSVGDSILLILALLFHSVFEGIAIGVAESKGYTWRVLWTVCLHKIFAAIAMGIALLRMIPNRPFLSCAAYAFAFAISSPIGVGIGIIIDATTEGPVPDWMYAISMSIACGVFVYVAINHLLAKGYIPHSPNPLNKPIYKFMAVLLGAAVIAVVMIWDT